MELEERILTKLFEWARRGDVEAAELYNKLKEKMSQNGDDNEEIVGYVYATNPDIADNIFGSF